MSVTTKLPAGTTRELPYTPVHDIDADLTLFDEPGKPPLLPRLLRLRHLRLTWWQRVLLGDLPLGLGLLTALSDLATAWVILALPAAVMAMVKLHDVVAGGLAGAPGPWAPVGGWTAKS